MFVKDLSDSWELHDNSKGYFEKGGDFYALSFPGYVPKVEEIFIDPFNPTESEWTLFVIEHGDGALEESACS